MTTLVHDPLLIFRYPLVLFPVCFFVLWLSAWIGASYFKKLRSQVAVLRDDFGVILGATLTLLGLIIGFTFSMALGRYDLRKNYEEQEPTRSAPNMSGPICCLRLTRRKCGRCC